MQPLPSGSQSGQCACAKGRHSHAALSYFHEPRPTDYGPLWLIDLVGIARHRHLSRQRRVQNLARLHLSFYQTSLLTRTDRLRFLRVYLQWGLFGRQGWKSWWHDIERAALRKIARNQPAMVGHWLDTFTRLNDSYFISSDNYKYIFLEWYIPRYFNEQASDGVPPLDRLRRPLCLRCRDIEVRTDPDRLWILA